MAPIQVSIITPAYNAARFITETIQSVQRQTLASYEHIIIDDGSTDNTVQRVRLLAESDARILLLENGTNQGLIRTPNRGLALARGKFIARLDADDLWHPEKLVRQVAFLANNPQIIALGTQGEEFGDSAKPMKTPCSPQAVRRRLLFDNPLFSSSMMWRNSWLQQRGLQYREEGGHAEDYDLWAQIILAGGEVANLPETLLQYRIHGQSVTRTKYALQQRSAAHVKLRQWQALGVELSGKEEALISAGLVTYALSAEDLSTCRSLHRKLSSKLLVNSGLAGTYELGRFFSGLLPRPASPTEKLCLLRALARVSFGMVAAYAALHVAGHQ